MILEKLEVKNHRSIKDQWGEQAIKFEGLDCLVGKNNVGKTNIISAIKYLLEDEDKALDEELYWKMDQSLEVEVRGYFLVDDDDLTRIENEDRREQINELLLKEGEFENHLGIARRTEPESQGQDTSFLLIQYRPVEEHYKEETFVETRDDYWDKKDEEDFTGTDYRDAMIDEYPEVAEYVDDDSLTNKGAWKDGYDAFVKSRPDDLDLEPTPIEFPSGTVNAIRETLLPHLIKIPAIKEVEDAAQASGELGELTDALYGELQEDVNDQLDEQLGGVYDRLDQDSRSFENRISQYLREAFRDYSVELDYPKVESRQFFRDVNIRIDDQQLDDTLDPENVGEGVRRILIFSILRTIADLRHGTLQVTDGEDDQKSENRPLLILYEEAELFLHPNLQKNLLRVFRSLCVSQAQIIFNTHSPLLIQNDVLDTINLVRDNSGTEVTQFHTILSEKTARQQSRLMDLQKVSSYIFSDKAVLVEGGSDELILRKISTRFDPEWDFQTQGIPVLAVGGKSDLPLFKEFLEELGLKVFVMTDIGSLRSTVENLLDDDFPTHNIEQLREGARSLVEDGIVKHTWNSDDIERRILNASWERTIERYKDLVMKLENEEEVDQTHIDSLKKLIKKKQDDAWRTSITVDHERINDQRLELRKQLLEQDILVLKGEIEDYYPDVGRRNKNEAALEFSPMEYSHEELREHFVEIPGEESTDLEIFLDNVFNE